jgi:transglutaminase-like putative cysteine protease
MRKLSLRHVTRYLYPQPARFLPHRLLLRPREGHDVRVVSSRLLIEPECTVVWHRDVCGNSVGVASFGAASNTLSVVSEVSLEHYEEVPFDYPLDAYADSFPFQYDAAERLELMPYQQLLFAREDHVLRSWVSEFWRAGERVPTAELLRRLNEAIPARMPYVRREEPGVQRPSQTLAMGSGSCRDFATLFMESCRFLGIAARFVSGYLHAPGLPDVSGTTHAWTEVYLPGAGWRGYDSTTGDMVGGDHIPVAVSRHPESVPPVSGAFEGGGRGVPTMQVEVAVGLLT